MKFRAWDKEFGEMRSWEHLRWIGYNKEWFRDNTGEDKPNDMWSDESFILEQATGLKDKNGTDIYEGDIVKKWGTISRDDPAYGFYEPTGTVKWFEDVAGFGCSWDSPKAELLAWLELEVIGNIHEGTHE